MERLSQKRQAIRTASDLGTALVYCRVSTARQGEEGTSLESQERACRAEAAKLGYRTVQVFPEMHTGAKLHERPVLAEVRKLLGEGRAVALIVYAYDRLARNQTHQAIIADELDRANVQLISVTEGALDNSALGVFVRNTYSFVAELEREKIVERTLRGKHARLLAGKIHNLGPELYGYRRNKKLGVREIHEPEAHFVQQIFHWVAEEGVSLRSVAAKLTAAGVPSPWATKGFDTKGWNPISVRNMLLNPSYKGETVQWVRRCVRRRMEPRPESEHVRLPESVTPALVTPEVWQRAQERLAANKGEVRRNSSLPFLLRGHIVCANCGSRMYPMPIGRREKRFRYYRCSSYVRRFAQPCGGSMVRAERCEAWAWDEVSRHLQNPQLIAQEVERVRAEGVDPQLMRDREVARRALERHDQGLQRLVRRLRNADDKLAEFIEGELTQLSREKQTLLKAVADLDARIEQQERAAVNLKSLYDYCRKVELELANFGFAEQRLALEALGAVVQANGPNWRIDTYLPSYVEPLTVSSNCFRITSAPAQARHPPGRATTRPGLSWRERRHAVQRHKTFEREAKAAGWRRPSLYAALHPGAHTFRRPAPALVPRRIPARRLTTHSTGRAAGRSLIESRSERRRARRPVRAFGASLRKHLD